jgi:hypothetical protein
MCLDEKNVDLYKSIAKFIEWRHNYNTITFLY